MRREIPFKAWDKQQNKFICDWTKGRPAHYEGSKYPIIHGGIDYMCIYIYNEPDDADCELVYITSKKDKRGYTISEGDILKYKNPKYPDHELYIIKFNEEDLCFECVNGSNYMLPSVWNQMEIVGNKFENPDLVPKGF